MRLLLLAVGKSRAGPAKDLFEQYRARLRPLLVLIEVEEKRPLAGPALMRREKELLMEQLKRRRKRDQSLSIIVALDEHGMALDTGSFARRIANWRDRGVEEVIFLIGGAEGLDPAVKSAADFLLSLGPMTWPHMLARSLLVEQLYRAQQILAGHPYHRD
jgi:23S rRNA (pseudouridine1915-N3)-methyltransferase